MTKITEQMNPKFLVHQLNIDKYEHMDFVWGLDAASLLYPDVLAQIQSYLPLDGTDELEVK